MRQAIRLSLKLGAFTRTELEVICRFGIDRLGQPSMAMTDARDLPRWLSLANFLIVVDPEAEQPNFFSSMRELFPEVLAREIANSYQHRPGSNEPNTLIPGYDYSRGARNLDPLFMNHPWVLHFLDLPNAAAYVDLLGGKGAEAIAVAKRFPQLQAINLDGSPWNIRDAIRISPTTLTHLQHRLNDVRQGVTLENDSVDVFSILGYALYDQPREFMLALFCEVLRILKSGGRIVFDSDRGDGQLECLRQAAQNVGSILMMRTIPTISLLPKDLFRLGQNTHFVWVLHYKEEALQHVLASRAPSETPSPELERVREFIFNILHALALESDTPDPIVRAIADLHLYLHADLNLPTVRHELRRQLAETARPFLLTLLHHPNIHIRRGAGSTLLMQTRWFTPEEVIDLARQMAEAVDENDLTPMTSDYKYLYHYTLIQSFLFLTGNPQD